MGQRIQNDQIVLDQPKTHIKSTTRQKLDKVWSLIDDHFNYPGKVLFENVSGVDTVLRITESPLQKMQGTTNDSITGADYEALAAVGNFFQSYPLSRVDLTTGSISGTVDLGSPPSTTNGYWRWLLITARSDSGSYQLNWGDQVSSIPAFGTAMAAKPANQTELASIRLQNSGGGTWNYLRPAITDIFNHSRGGGGATGSSASTGGGEIVDNLFNARLTDSFSELPTATNNPTVDISTGKTNTALFSPVYGYYRLAYDASQTVSGYSTTMVISGTPAFTVSVGDILVVGTEQRRITTVTDQTHYSIEAAFVTTPTPAATACCISQAVYTVDINQAVFDGLSVYSQITDSISEVLVGYTDSETLADITPDWGSAALIAASVSCDGTSWNDKFTRPTNITDIYYSTSPAVAGTNLYIRFFANKSSGSGSVNLLDYKALWHRQTSGSGSGSNPLVAYARPNAGVYVNCSHSVLAGKSRITFSTPYGRGLTATNPAGSALDVFGNGQKFPLYIAGTTDATQAYFKEISDTVIELDQDYSLTAVQFLFKTPATIVDSNTNNTSRIANLEAVTANTSLELVVRPMINVPYTTIINRAQIPDLTQDLSIKGPVERIAIQNVFEIQNEVGPNGEKVWGAQGDRDGLIRFVGSSWFSSTGAQGTLVGTDYQNEYFEIPFYGTGLNLLAYGNSSDLRVSIDGGAEGANILPTFSGVLLSRNYAQNIIVPMISGLSVGFHTAKIRNASAGTMPRFYGIEILNESTTLKCLPGTYYAKGTSFVKSTASTLPFKPAAYVSGGNTKGACVVNYQNLDGSQGQVYTPVPASPSYMAGADHTNEQMIRLWHWREFGCGRADDWSTLDPTGRASTAFTAEDGVHTLVGSNQRAPSSGSANFYRSSSGGGDFSTFTFVGTGLDIIASSSGSGPTDNLYIDGTLVAYNTATVGGVDSAPVNFKIASSLPYGTHTFKLVRVAGSNTLNIHGFKVYAPKTPTIPTTAKEISSYYVVADPIGNTVGGIETISTGCIRKHLSREAVYVGSWSMSLNTGHIGGWFLNTNTVSDYMEYSFMGTGIGLRGYPNGNTMTMYINGILVSTANFNINGSGTPTYGTITVGVSTSGWTFNSANGQLSGSGAADADFWILGLALGKYTFKMVLTTYSVVPNFDCVDIFTPIYFPKVQTNGIRQNTLSVGNCSVGDLRKTWLEAVAKNKVRAEAMGITATPNTTSTSYVPVPDMSLTVNSPGADFLILFSSALRTNSTSTVQYIACFVDGFQVGREVEYTSGVANAQFQVGGSALVYLSQGTHKIDMYGKAGSGATLTFDSTSRFIQAIEL